MIERGLSKNAAVFMFYCAHEIEGYKALEVRDSHYLFNFREFLQDMRRTVISVNGMSFVTKCIICLGF